MDLDKAITLAELCKAANECRKNVLWKDSVASFYTKQLTKSYSLKYDIEHGRYKLQPYVRFTIYEPKQREILATRMRDRVFQRALCNNGVYVDMIRAFINDNGACQKGKGIDFTVGRVKEFLHSYYRKYGNNGYALHLDVKKFFPSTRHDVAKAVIAKRIKDTRTLKYLFEIIDSFGDVGIGLGSQFSQLVQLAVLDGLDHFIKEKLHIKYYVRYMDDLLLISNSKEDLSTAKKEIAKELAKIGLELKKDCGAQKIAKGITYLKIKFILTDTGKLHTFITKQSVVKEKRRLRMLVNLLNSGKMHYEDIMTHYQSWSAHILRVSSKKALYDMNEYFKTLFHFTPIYKKQ